MWTAPYGVECVWCRMLVKLLDTFGSPSSIFHDEFFNLQCSPSYHADARCLSRIGVYRLASFLFSWRPPKETLHFLCSSEPIEEQPSHVSRTLGIRVRMEARKDIIAVFQAHLDRNWSKHVISSFTLPATLAGTNWHNCWVVLHASVTKWTRLVIIPSAIFKPRWHPKSS